MLSLTDDDVKKPQTTNYTVKVHITCNNTDFFNECPTDEVKVRNNSRPPVFNDTKPEEVAPVIKKKTNKLWAKIISLSDEGLLTIRFRDYMQTKKFGRFDKNVLS